ncbi:MAG: WhiB family transcriptional regulator [Candidatus Nanopelagicales bacterium]
MSITTSVPAVTPAAVPPSLGFWAERSACLSVADPEIFFPSESDSQRANRAKQVCAMCPVMDVCLEYAMQVSTLDGVWGGTTAQERKRMRRARRRRSMMA